MVGFGSYRPRPFVQQKAGADIPKDIRSRCDVM